MNTAQKAALGIGVVAIVLMGIFPPWNLTFDLHSESGGVHSTNPAGYAPIYEPPKPPETPQWSFPVYTVSIDVSRLMIQWAIVGAVTGGLVLILRSNMGGRGRSGPNTSVLPAKVIPEKTAGVAPQEQSESTRVSDYPPIWSQAHTLPQTPIRPISDPESQRWPWRRVALWTYNWRAWLAFVGAFSILALPEIWREFGEYATRAPDMAATAMFVITIVATVFVVAIVYAYVKLFTDPNRAARVLLCAYIGSAVLGVVAIGFGSNSSSRNDWGWIALVYGGLMGCLCQPLIRPRFARLANMLDGLRQHGIPHSLLPKQGGGMSVSLKPPEQLSLWKLYRQVAIGTMILPEETDHDVENDSGPTQGVC